MAERMHPEFARLAAARRIMAVPPSTGAPTADRVRAERANAERWVERFGGAADPGDGAVVERRAGSVLVRPAVLDERAPHVLYVHGGGMVYYSTTTFLPFLRLLATTLRAPVEAFDYPKAPEHTAEESLARLGEAVAARCAEPGGRRPVIAGDSVGGLFALHLALRVLPGAFARAVLIYPVLDLRTERDSYREFGEGHFLDRTAMRGFKSFLEPFFSARGLDPLALSDAELAALPPCSLVTAGCDVLRDEGLAWARFLADRSVPLRHSHFPDLPHDFCLYAAGLDSARRAAVEIAATAFDTEEDHAQPR
ncbi:alpha/beta hydrolase fold domain-containing protein [Actinosynnema pretiosum subsp. pretiosum]|nr:alpha/beta hydrolase [Actinosynnema mirum]AXX31562.1 putative esterase [Actinosynnema pretiosum subsp. pretiosum]QUF04407.1 alpha/beta hydrolase fold domain-containing protein [Actinosynnema pretiosum subsp. pretiosum]